MGLMTADEVCLSPAWMARCRVYGDAVAEHRRLHRANHYRKLINDIQRRPDVLAHAKAGEVAFALKHGLDPNTEVEWRIGFGGNPWDVMLNDKRVDVKTLQGLYSECVLMWGVGMWPEDFEKHDFDVMALVAGKDDRFIFKGWVSKADFRKKHRLASGHRLIPVDGTPYMEDHELEMAIWPPCPVE